MKSYLFSIKRFLSPQAAAHLSDKIVAALGGCLSIYLVALISVEVAGLAGAAAIVPSMGAAAVLLFAVPHGPMSQPWALLAGNLLSALVGVCCARWIDNIFIAGALAVGLSIAVMHVCRCLHPPGGATALAAVVGGEAIRELGFSYALLPILLNCTVLFGVAMVFNNIFSWRRYPLSLMKYQMVKPVRAEGQVAVGLQQIEQALEQADVMVDVAPQQLLDLFRRAQLLAQQAMSSSIPIEVGAFYANDKPGAEWSVRQVLEESRHTNSRMDLIIYRVMDGKDRHKSGCSTREEFALWMKSRVKPARGREDNTG